MDDQRGSGRDDQPANPDEGVRIIGPDEAAEAVERGEIASRRTDDELRYGDRPPGPPDGPRPALRFPLDASADPTNIERPPVEPPPEPVTGPVSLPHWTEPATGEVPAVLINDDGPLIEEGPEDELDAWSSFATSTPRWRDADDDWGDDDFVERLAQSGETRVGALGDADAEPSHDEYFGFDDMEARVEERTGDPGAGAQAQPRFEVGGDGDDWNATEAGETGDGGGQVVTVGADDQWGAEETWEDDAYAPIEDEGGGGGGFVPAGGGGERNMPMAIGVGVVLAVVGAIALSIGPFVTTVLVTVILAACAVEYFEALRKVGWESARLIGLVGCIALPLAVYWRGLYVFPMIMFLLVATVLVWYLVGAGGPDPRVLEGSGATMLGITWIGGLGAAAAGMLTLDDGRAMLLIAIAATVAYDVGGLFIGKAAGNRPLTAASPNKTVEGLGGGMLCALVVTVVMVAILGLGPWDGVGAGLILGLGVAVAAPLGDLCQSVLKRDLGVKDMGTILPGHGGVLDRFDAMLFVMPTVLWLTIMVGLS